MQLQTQNDLSRALYDLCKVYKFEHSVTLEYSDKKVKDYLERMRIKLENEDDERAIAFTVIITTYPIKSGSKNTTNPFEITLEVDDEEDGEDDWDFDSFDQIYSHIKNALEPKKAGMPAAPDVAALPHIKLMQQALTNGPQTTWLTWLDITKYNSLNELVQFQVACSMVGYAVHIAHVDHFLRAIDFDLNALNAPKHALASRVLTALKDGVVDKASILSSAKLNDEQGAKYLAFMLELQEGAGTIHGMIDLRPQDEEEEVDNE